MQHTRPRKLSDPSSKIFHTRWLLLVVAIILIGWALQALSAVAIPVVFALLITLIVAPLDQRIKEAMPPKLGWVAHLCIMALILGVLSLFLGGLGFAAQKFLDATPDLMDQIDQLLPGGTDQQGGAAQQGGTALRDLLGSASNALGNWLVEKGSVIAETAVAMTGTLFSVIVLVFFIILLVLSELDLWDCKMQSLLTPPERARLGDVLAKLAERLRQFLILRAAIGALQAGLYVGWLALFGVDLLAVWAVITLLLTFIPNLGSIISGTLPVLYAWLTKDIGTAAAVAAGIFVIEQVVGNFIDPVILGNRILLSPAVILVSLIFWGWLWGIPGAFLATPLMLVLLIGAAHVERLRPLALLLSNQSTLKDLDTAL